MVKKIQSIYSIYKANSALLIPLIAVSGLVIINIESIPYINLRSDTVISFILAVNWFVILWISKIETKYMFIISLMFIGTTSVFSFLKFNSIADQLMNLTYIILATATAFEIKKRATRHEN